MKRQLAMVLCASLALGMQAQDSKVFEMRYFTKDKEASGVTDFHGPAEWLDTGQRVAMLNSYARYASRFWGDPGMDTPMFDETDVRERLAAVKPQPLTSVRRTVVLDSWRSYGYKDGKVEEQAERWKKWTDGGALIQDGFLLLDGVKTAPEINPIDWRFNMKMTLETVDRDFEVIFSDEDGTLLKVALDGLSGNVEIYGDLECRVLFLSSQGKTVREIRLPDSFGDRIATFSLDSSAGRTVLDFFSLYGFVRDHEYDFAPYHTELHYDEDFRKAVSVDGWQNAGYDDSSWELVSLPSPHGGQNVAGESYYLRTKVEVGSFAYASLEIDTIDPAGEVWVNGDPVAVTKGRVPRSIDVGEYLLPDRENIIAVRVKPQTLFKANLHSPSDHNVGWSLGRTRLILTDTPNHIVSDHVHTASLTGTQALQKHKIRIKSEYCDPLEGSLTVNYYPWFPEEGPCVASVTRDIHVRPRIENVYDIDMPLENPDLWTTEDPKLYRVEVILKDAEGRPVDDHVTTTGVRFIEQKEGVLYINNRPEILGGAQNFGFRLPIEYMSRYVYCATDEMVMRELMMIERMGGNLLRIHVHADSGISEGVNDPRYAEYADQLGLYLIWQTPAWTRESQAWNVDIDDYPLYMRQVMNHPSIVMWEASNHPTHFKSYDFSETDDYFTSIITAVTSTDTSRLVSPTSFWQHAHYADYAGTVDHEGNRLEPNPLLLHRKLTRGSQDAYTGYGHDWSELRNHPYPWAKSCLEARDLCYFNFEHEESAAQPNWELARKSPWYHVPSYEWKYEEGSIGRYLQFDEWRASQAFQAFAAWESMKIQTLAGVSGFSWCSLESGPNMFTYQKPLVDPFLVPKLAFHANTMAFQRIWAGSDDVDTVYSPEDEIRPVIFNLEDSCLVNLTVELQNENGKVLERKVFSNIEVPAGRSVTRLEPFRFRSGREGCFFVVYEIRKL